MPELSHIDPRSAALLVMDYQVDALTRFMTTAQSADAIACVPDLIGMARGAGMMVIHVVVAFRPGHPEVSPRNPLFSWAKANGMLVAGSEGAAIPSGRIGTRRGTDCGQAPHQPVCWHRPGDAATRQRHRHTGARRCPYQRRRAVDRSSGWRSGLSVDRRPRLLRRPRCSSACDAARHRHREAGGRRHHGGARRRPAWNLLEASHETKRRTSNIRKASQHSRSQQG